MVSIPKLSKMRRPVKVYTFDEYLHREAQAAEKHEFYNGKIITMPEGISILNIHSEISANVIGGLKVEVRPLPHKFRVYTSDLKIYIEPANTGVYPDAVVICEVPEYWQKWRDIIVNPLLIVEVLSPSTQAYDRLGKFELYKMLPSFQEYVLINADTPAVETRFQEERNLWRIHTETDLEKLVHLRSLGVSIAMNVIYEDIVFPI
jgi:Uma2 family endonuclease